MDFVALGAQTSFYVAQAFPVGDLGERHTQELVEASKALDLEIASIADDTSAKDVHGHEVDDLRKYQLADVHG